MRIEAVCAVLPGLDPAAVADWIARGWVAPDGEAPDWRFAEIDVARVRLIRDLRVDAGIEAESLSVVLSLLDQVYDLRRTLHAVVGAIVDQPVPVRETVREAVLVALRR